MIVVGRGRGAVSRRNNISKPEKGAKSLKIESKDKEVLQCPPKPKEINFTNRCCYVKPNNRDFGQYYAGISPKYTKGIVNQQMQSDLGQLLLTMTDMKEPKKVPCVASSKAKTSLEHTSQTNDNNTSMFPAVSTASNWQTVDGSEDVDKILSAAEPTGVTDSSSKHMFISKMPRVKVIAKKMSKFKRGNLELRRLDEKVVCVEYDIYCQASNDKDLKPVQKMKAYFSIKPFDNDSCETAGSPRIPPNVKNEFKVSDEDLEKITDKEIEFIDEKVEENKSYLEDCRRILKRNKAMNAQKNKTSLDLLSLYEMANREKQFQCDYTTVNLLSNAELREVKDLILKQCTSSLHGFRRRKIKQKEKGFSPDIGIISESIMVELLTITKNLNV